MNTSLPTDSAERKTYPMVAGLLGYFPAALAGVAHHSWKSNAKHNAGQPLHWSIDKSNDHAECVLRHLLDLQELFALLERNPDHGPCAIDGVAFETCGNTTRREAIGALLAEADALAWRALALSQTLRMRFTGAPLPFNARREEKQPTAAELYGRGFRAPLEAPLEGWPNPRCADCKKDPCTCYARG